MNPSVRFVWLFSQSLRYLSPLTQEFRFVGYRTVHFQTPPFLPHFPVSLFHHLHPISLSLYVYSISVALQALTVISMGGIADHRKPLPRPSFLSPLTSPSHSAPSKKAPPIIRSPRLPRINPLPPPPLLLSPMVPLLPPRHLRERRVWSFCGRYERVFAGAG